MRLPENILGQGKRALQALWDDTATIIRQEENGNVIGEEPVYTGLPCHLSVSAQPALSESATAATVQRTYSLRLDGGIVVKPGDSVVITHKGQTYTGKAGEAFERSFCLVVPITDVVIA